MIHLLLMMNNQLKQKLKEIKIINYIIKLLIKLEKIKIHYKHLHYRNKIKD